jgi:hypothetical protein
MVTTVSIRLALRKIAEVACGTRPGLLRVTARVHESRRTYSASIPFEYQDEVCQFLRQRLAFQTKAPGSILIFTEEQAQALLAVALELETSAASLGSAQTPETV